MTNEEMLDVANKLQQFKSSQPTIMGSAYLTAICKHLIQGDENLARVIRSTSYYPSLEFELIKIFGPRNNG